MRSKIKSIFETIIIIATLLIVEVAMYFVANAIVWVQMLFTPYTHLGAIWLSVGHHFICMLLGLVITYAILSIRRKK